MNEDMLFNIFLDISFIALSVSFVVSKERSLRKTFQALGFRKIKAAGLLKKTGVLFLAMLAAAIWLGLASTFLGLNDLQLVTESLEEMQAAMPAFFWLIMLRVISEEIFFRGLLTSKLGAIASSAIFAVFHWGYGSAAEVAGTFIIGIILAKAFQLNKNLYPNILAHALYNAMILLSI